MEKRIQLERRARKAHQITELNLDNCRSTSIVGLTDEYTSLESLSLINVGLTTLKGFPKLPNLKKLELSDNRISNGLNYLNTSPKLQYLNLSGNRIQDLETLKPLQEFKHLTILDLFNNQATQIDNYRDKIFEMLPSLKFLDGFDCNDVEAASEVDDDEEPKAQLISENQNAFSFNGIEIDLDELEEFEKRVKAKREAKSRQHQDISTANSNSLTEIDSNINGSDNTLAENADVDDLDEYLKTLKLREQQSEKDRNSDTEMGVSNNLDMRTANFALLLYWFLAILNLASATFNNLILDDDEEDDEDDEDDDEESSSEIHDSSGDIALSEVYNDDLEADEDEWDEEVAAESNDCDDLDSDDDDANESFVANADKNDDGNASGEEPQARGKKRKHEG